MNPIDFIFTFPVSSWLVFLVVMNAFAALTLMRASQYGNKHDRRVKSLRERAWLATLLTVALAIAMVTLLDRRLGTNLIPNEARIIIGPLAASLAGVPGLYWLWLYFRGRFGS